jgi:hypothetical protein
MNTFSCGAILALVSLCYPVAAQEARCAATGCNTAIYIMRSASDSSVYGMLATLPADAPCVVGRIVAVDMQDRHLGESGLLSPGEQGRIRLGHGFVAGLHPMRLFVSGCAAQPAQMRRITLNKASPDHGWRATGA